MRKRKKKKINFHFQSERLASKLSSQLWRYADESSRINNIPRRELREYFSRGARLFLTSSERRLFNECYTNALLLSAEFLLGQKSRWRPLFIMWKNKTLRFSIKQWNKSITFCARFIDIFVGASMTDYTVSRERRRAGDLELELAGFESRERVCVCE